MKCPCCNVELKMTDRQNVEIDYCPQCRGVWLDRGELDKIISRSSFVVEEEITKTQDRTKPPVTERDDYPNREKRRGSFLGDLFDF
ncbi:MAG: zf-TFIIB domain-containing protein [Chitinophagales bacterium]|nr:zf-TFIIB domain-containing protein [Chitinophagales bacterium]